MSRLTASISGAAKVSVSLISVLQLGQVIEGSTGNSFPNEFTETYADSRKIVEHFAGSVRRLLITGIPSNRLAAE